MDKAVSRVRTKYMSMRAFCLDFRESAGKGREVPCIEEREDFATSHEEITRVAAKFPVPLLRRRTQGESFRPLQKKINSKPHTSPPPPNAPWEYHYPVI
jgi:hypothetical protein